VTARILVFAGASRTGSFNKKLAALAAAALRAAGAEVTHVDLRDFPMPLYDGDLEASQGIPEHAMRMKALFLAHDGLMLACPEYNSSITGLLKNTIDWVSRSAPGETPLSCFDGKIAALVSASPGALGGLRGLVHVRAILGNIGVFVVPAQLAVSRANDAFDEAGKLKDAKQQASLEKVARQLVTTVTKLRAG
jgi:chromate reductase, NAD(P)H dehydrogenase (quinone)